MRWLLGGMLILSLVSAVTLLAETGATVLAIRMAPTVDVAGLVGAGAGMAIYVSLLVGLVYWVSDLKRTPALLGGEGSAGVAAVVVCVVMVLAVVGAFGARIFMARYMGPAMMGKVHQVQAYLQHMRALVMPIGVVVAMVVLRKR